MAQITKNPNDTFTLELGPAEQKLVKRLSDAGGLNKAQYLEKTLNGMLANRATDLGAVDRKTLFARYSKATPSVQAQVEAILPPA